MTLKVTQSRSSEMAQYPLEFHWDVWHQKTRVPQLSCDVVCVMTCLSVSIDHQLVIDRWMDRQTKGHQATAYVALAQHCAVTIWTSIVHGCDRDELANQVDCRPTQNPEAVRDHADCRQFVTRVTYQSVAGNLLDQTKQVFFINSRLFQYHVQFKNFCWHPHCRPAHHSNSWWPRAICPSTLHFFWLPVHRQRTCKSKVGWLVGV